MSDQFVVGVNLMTLPKINLSFLEPLRVPVNPTQDEVTTPLGSRERFNDMVLAAVGWEPLLLMPTKALW